MSSKKDIRERVAAAFEHAYPSDEPIHVPSFLIPENSAPLDCLGRKIKEVNGVAVPYDAVRRVTVMEDHCLKIPELWLNVFVFGPDNEARPFAKMFARAKCFKANTPDEADLVVFVGGEDVDPQLYGQKPHKRTVFNPDRDKADIRLFGFCAKQGIPMFGVCRGAQFLHVMHGGALYQDVDNHNSPHSMWDIRGKEMLERISSVHHQSCIPNAMNGMELLASSNKSENKWSNNIECKVGKGLDVEAFFYRKDCCLGVQGHPEYAGYNRYTQWCCEQLDKHLNENPDLGYRANDAGQNKLRIKQELLDERVALKGKALVTIPSEEMIIVENVGLG